MSDDGGDDGSGGGDDGGSSSSMMLIVGLVVCCSLSASGGVWYWYSNLTSDQQQQWLNIFGSSPAPAPAAASTGPAPNNSGGSPAPAPPPPAKTNPPAAAPAKWVAVGTLGGLGKARLKFVQGAKGAECLGASSVGGAGAAMAACTDAHTVFAVQKAPEGDYYYMHTADGCLDYNGSGGVVRTAKCAGKTASQQWAAITNDGGKTFQLENQAHKGQCVANGAHGAPTSPCSVHGNTVFSFQRA